MVGLILIHSWGGGQSNEVQFPPDIAPHPPSQPMYRAILKDFLGRLKTPEIGRHNMPKVRHRTEFTNLTMFYIFSQTLYIIGEIYLDTADRELDTFS